MAFETRTSSCVSPDDWLGLQGTALRETMFRNRLLIDWSVSDDRILARVYDDLRGYLEQSCKGFYHVPDDFDVVYFEHVEEQVAFALAHKEYVAPEIPPPLLKKKKPIHPYTTPWRSEETKWNIDPDLEEELYRLMKYKLK